MDAVWNFIWEFRYFIMWGVVFLVTALLDWQKFKTDLTGLMLGAKDMAKDGLLKSGDAQAEWVIKKAFEKLPKRWVDTLGEERLKNLIKKLYLSMMEKLVGNKTVQK